MKVYLRIWGRPIGAEPKFFSSKEEATVECKCDEICSPWCVPDIEEFESKLEARRFLKTNYLMIYEEAKTKLYLEQSKESFPQNQS